MPIRTIVIGFWLLAFAAAQDPYGRIAGRVLDSTGAVIPGAAIRVVNLETNVAAHAISNAEGNYAAQNLNPGRYRVEVQQQGFKRYERGPVEVRIGDVLNVEIRLELGAASDQITVTAEAPLLDSANSSLGQVIDNRRVLDLPVPSSNPIYLAQLAPGVISTLAPTAMWLPNANGPNSEIASNGTRTRANEFALDGIPNMAQNGAMAFVPPPEMIQEFRVQTAAFDASIGHFTGASINMVLKTGTNSLHGNVFYSFNGRKLNAHDFFTNRFIYDTRTGPVTPEKIDGAWPASVFKRYRVTGSGPVYIPKVYDGRNRTFWTYGLDINDMVRVGQSFYTIPTAAERAGNFSELLAIGSQYQIYDPATIAAAPNGRFSRQLFAGNLIPASRLDAMAKRLAGYYATPNAVGSIDGRNNYSWADSRLSSYRSHTTRVDHAIGQNQRAYASYSESFLDATSGRIFQNDALGTHTTKRHHAFALDDVLTPRPDLVIDLRYGLTRYSTWDRPMSLGLDLRSLGFPAPLVNRLTPGMTSFPEIAIDGFQGLGSDSGSSNVTTYHHLAATGSHMRGNHGLRFGAEFRVLQENNYNFGYVTPHLDFSSQWTKGPLDTAAAAPIGQGLASFLLGVPTGGYIDRNPSYAEQSRYLGLFLQDDWKITRKLTLNLGLRYEYDFPTTERYNRTNRGFAFGATNPIQDAAGAAYARSPIPEVPASQFRTSGGLLFAGVAGVPRGLWDADPNNFSPRIGLAYLLREKTVMRAGYGVFVESIGADRVDVFQQGFSQRTSVTPSFDNGLTFRASLADPFPDGFLEPVGASAGLSTFLGRAVSFFLPSRRAGYNQRWSFSIQQQLPGRLLVEIGYVGSKAVGLGISQDYNPTPAQYFSSLPVRDQAAIDFLNRTAPNPFSGMAGFEGSNLQGKTITYSQLLKPYPEFAGVGATKSGGFSWYHALQVRGEKRFTRGYTLQGSYTWSKFMEAVDMLNSTDPLPAHVISPVDRPHNLVMSGVYELPFGRGRRFLSTAPRWAGQVVGGWSVQAIYHAQIGAPMGFGNIFFYGDIHNLVLPKSQRTVERWFNTAAGFETDSRKQPASNIRTFPQRLTGLRVPGYNSWDLSVFKNIRVRERVTFQLRGEAQDAMNHPMFNGPNTNPANLLFGSINGVATAEQRRIIVGGKMTW